ncbi:MAG: glycosyltransferase family 4 protein, partial [Alicyclobacillus sp.]|nr:glycosyltransferase family 4 protein [Alicyclobacillus sp.]
VHVCPVGIHAENYVDISKGEPQGWETELSARLSQGMVLLCHVGRLDKMDNIPFLLRVLKELPNRFHMVLAGEPRQFGIACAEKIGVSGRVTFLGRVENRLIGRLFQSAHLTLACSPFEPFGLSVAESLYHGCPVVAHPTGGIMDLVVDRLNGAIVPKRDPATWAQCICEVSEPTRLQALRLNAKLGGHELTWASRARAYVDVYHHVCDLYR